MLHILRISITLHNFRIIYWVALVSLQPHNFLRPPRCYSWSWIIKKYEIGVAFDGTTFILSCVKIGQLVRSWGGEGDTKNMMITQVYFISLRKECRLKIYLKICSSCLRLTPSRKQSYECLVNLRKPLYKTIHATKFRFRIVQYWRSFHVNRVSPANTLKNEK
jgi:hypothetical protein